MAVQEDSPQANRVMSSEESQALFVQVVGSKQPDFKQIDEVENEESNSRDRPMSDDEDVSFLKELEREN